MGSLFDLAKLWRLAVYVFLAILSLHSYASSDKGIAWLKAQQGADGAFSATHSQATVYQATVESLLALYQLSALENTATQSASEFLRSKSSGHIEDIASVQRLKKINPVYFSADTDQLIGFKSAAGGYGDYPGYESSVVSSALIAHAFTTQEARELINLNEIIAYLLAKQKADKGWAEEPNRSSIYATALVSRALQAQRFTFNVSDTISSATEYLLVHQKPGGGWSGNLETAMALLAVIPATADSSRYKNAVDHLIAAQLANGSWNNDAYTTALALQVLYLIKNPPIINNPTAGSISGRLISAASNLPISSTQIIIAGPTGQFVIGDDKGHFSVANLNPGTYLLTYKTPGFQSADKTIQVNAGEHVDLGVIKLNVLPIYALLYGKVTDSSTGLPLSGVVIKFTGNQNVQVSTDQNGNYSLELTPGQTNISIEQNGYRPIGGAMNAFAGKHVDFSPALRPLNSAPATGITLQGRVVDAQSNMPLPGASVRIISTAINEFSNTEGKFMLSGLSAGTANVEIAFDGYQAITFTSLTVANNNVDIGTVYLEPAVPDNSTLYGKIIDAITGAPIPGANVMVDNQFTKSDANGVYELKNIRADIFGVSVAAEGYQLANSQIRVAEHGKIKQDISLKKIQISDVGFKQLSQGESFYGPYEEVKLSGVILNQGTTAKSVVIQTQIINPVGIIIGEFLISRNITSGAQSFELNPQTEMDFTASWLTQSYAPGHYKIVMTAYASTTSQILAQQQTTVEIRPTVKIASIKPVATVDNLKQGSVHDIGITVSVRNQSNVPVSLHINYSLFDPANNMLFTGDGRIDVAPNELYTTFNLGSHTQFFNSSGAYKLRILSINPVQPLLIESDVINVMPDISINMEQTLTPTVVVPDENGRLRVKIRLEGTEVK